MRCFYKFGSKLGEKSQGRHDPHPTPPQGCLCVLSWAPQVDLAVRFISEECGYGVVTTQNLPKGQCVGEYTGEPPHQPMRPLTPITRSDPLAGELLLEEEEARRREEEYNAQSTGHQSCIVHVCKAPPKPRSCLCTEH